MVTVNEPWKTETKKKWIEIYQSQLTATQASCAYIYFILRLLTVFKGCVVNFFTSWANSYHIPCFYSKWVLHEDGKVFHFYAGTVVSCVQAFCLARLWCVSHGIFQDEAILLCGQRRTPFNSYGCWWKSPGMNILWGTWRLCDGITDNIIFLRYYCKTAVCWHVDSLVCKLRNPATRWIFKEFVS